MLENIQAVIFDFDGTLYDFKGLPKNLCLSSIPNLLKINAVQKTRKQMKGKDFSTPKEYQNHFFSLLKELGKFKSVEIAEEWYKKLYMLKMIQVLERKYTKRNSVEVLFRFLKSKNIKIAIYSDYGMLKERLLAVDFDEKFLSENVDLILSSEDFGCLKPAKKGFLEVVKKLEVNSENCLMIGDRFDTDGVGALNSGMMYIEIKTHKTKDDYKPNHPLIEFEELSKVFN